ncbi:MAG: YggU family protein [Gammaproteobacteria bacterium]|nr:YggU family protein [Gammaproteobacteria bacterium]MCP5136405.1 YggU family protein [Gammaproteobacteria bacterium]
MSDVCRHDGADLILELHVQPKASRDEFCGRHGDRLKLRITAPPVDGKANAHVRAFLAKAFGVPKRDVVIEKGDTSRDKRIRIRAPKKRPVALSDFLVTFP